MFKPLAILCLLLPLNVRANPAESEQIKRGFELTSEKWMLEYKLATTPEAKEALLAKQPNPTAAATTLWANIAPSLKEEWTIPYAAFFLEITRNISSPIFAEGRQRIIKTFSETHLTNPAITPFIIALIESGDPQNLAVLEKAAEENPDKSVQGIAALGAAMQLKTLGDDAEIMAKRLNYLRKAIIQSADKTIGGKSVADIASDELYVIRYLVKGRVAPPLSGTDVANRQVTISDFKGKIVVLLFWDAKTEQTDKVIQLTNQLATKYKDQPVAILGVTPESAERIRTLQGDGSILWNNICDPSDKLAQEYRISSRPALFIIDAEGKIEYTGLPGSFAELTVDALLNPKK